MATVFFLLAQSLFIRTLTHNRNQAKCWGRGRFGVERPVLWFSQSSVIIIFLLQ